ncbi:sulfate reduction electron transfer complex DsrMKJOP subunit DsrP [Candidatus Pyrohabitans sp.]
MNRVEKLVWFALTSVKVALTGSPRYYAWLLSLLLIVIFGALTYIQQLKMGLIVTSMRDQVSWGSYISNFTFLVGVAAAAVMIVIPAYLYNKKDFQHITIFGELLAVGALVMCLSFVLIDLGRIDRAFHLLPIVGTPNWPQSLLTWDVIVLNGYLFLNLLIPGYMLYKKFYGEEPKKWIYIFILISIPWAISIHTVTAFLYGGLAATAFWNTALLAPRFLASAFTAGPALIIIILQVVRRFSCVGQKGCPLVVRTDTIFKLANIVLIAMIVNLFFLASEVYTIGYAGTSHLAPLKYLFFGLTREGVTYNVLTPYFWTAIFFNVIAAILLLIPKTRYNLATLNIAAFLAFTGIWIEKGMGLVIPGFIPTTIGEIWEYYPTVPEIMITLGVWALGFLIYTLLLKIALAIEAEEVKHPSTEEWEKLKAH